MQPQVMLQNDCIAHYRRDIYSLLCANDRVCCTVVAGAQPSAPFLKALTKGDRHGIRHFSAPVRGFQLPGGLRLTWQPGAVRYLLREHPDLIIALGSPYSITAWALALLGRIRKTPVLLWGHGLLTDEQGPKWWVRRAFYRLAWGHLLYGDDAKTLLQKKGFPANRLYVVYNSLNYDEQNRCAKILSPGVRITTRASLGLPLESRVIIFTGRLEPVKRLDLLVEAISVLKSRGRDVRAIIVGDGRERSALETLANEHGVEEHFRFLGEKYDEQTLAELYDASDLAVIPSGAGLSVIHALTYGVPVLIHDRVSEHFPEREAVLPGKTGFVYQYGDAHHMAEQIDDALFPEAKRPQMLESCRSVVQEKYNPHRQIETILSAIGDAVGSGEPRARSGD